MFSLAEHTHRRYNPLTGEYILVSPHRSRRPWQGKVEDVNEQKRPSYDPDCYLCPGNQRAGGKVNPYYDETFVFQNDFAALTADVPEVVKIEGLFRYKSERGICKVICFSPRHDLTIAGMQSHEVAGVVQTWLDQYRELEQVDFINHIQIFENKGELMGCSNPHPHGQIWAQESIPVEVVKKTIHLQAYFRAHGESLLENYIDQELHHGERIVFSDEHMVAVVPFWATWPFETMIVPRRHMNRITEMTVDEQQALANAYRRLTAVYDELFKVSFPYSAGIHQAPCDGADHAGWHWHMCFYPPLLRSATVKKFMVGYEMLADPQRDISAEQAASRLQGIASDVN